MLMNGIHHTSSANLYPAYTLRPVIPSWPDNLYSLTFISTHTHHKEIIMTLKYITIKRYTDRFGKSAIYDSTNLFNSELNVVVVTVNCEGVLGKGVALEARHRFNPLKEGNEQYEATYQRYCQLPSGDEYKLLPGMIQPWKTPRDRVGARVVLNAATKGLWRKPSEIAWIKSILKGLLKYIAKREEQGNPVTGIAISEIGCGLGGLSWDVVGPLFAQYLDDIDVPIHVYIEAGHVQYSQTLLDAMQLAEHIQDDAHPSESLLVTA